MTTLDQDMTFLDNGVYLLYTIGMLDSKIHQIHERFLELVRLSAQMDKTPRRFGTEEALTSREIHLIEISGDNDETLGVTDLARLLGITKGAVSQNLKKLEKKGFTTKIKDPENGSRSIIKLTSKGKTAYFAHRHWHETLDGGFKAYFMELSEDKVDFLLEFISKAEDFVKRVMR